MRTMRGQSRIIIDNDCTIDIDAILTDKTPWLVQRILTVSAMSSASFLDDQVAATTSGRMT